MNVIPEEYTLGAHTVTVKANKKKLADKHGVVGRYFEHQHLIELQAENSNYCLSEIEHTFYHEMVHSILHAMGETELNSNEKFVDLFAQFLYQANQTMRFPE